MTIESRRGILKKNVTKIPLLFLITPLFLRCVKKKEGEITENKTNDDLGEGLSTFDANDTLSEDELVEVMPEIFPTSFGQVCQLKNNTIDINLLPDAKEDYEARIICYGEEGSTLVALEFTKYQGHDLEEVFFIEKKGKLLAQKAINSSSDKRVDGTLKPIIFDHLQTKIGQEYALVLRLKGSLFTKYIFPKPLNFSKEFAGRVVYGLSASSLRRNELAYHHVDGLFAPNEEQFVFSEDKEEIFNANAMSKYKNNQDLLGAIITDIMGRVLSQSGEKFNEVIEHDIFIAYYLVDKKYYMRTIIKLV